MNAPALDLHLRRAPVSFEPATFNAEARTVTAVISTGAEVTRHDFNGEFGEALRINAAAIDRSYMPIPVLDNHQRSGSDNVLGVVEEIWVDGTRLLARLKFSARAGVAGILQDIADGILRSVSVGYTVEKFEETKNASGRRTKVATRWSPREVSIVAIGADPGASIRSEEMTTSAAAAASQQTPAAAPPTAPETETRAAINVEIRNIARLAGLNQPWIDGQIDRGATAEQARQAAFTAMQERASTAPTITGQHVQLGADFTDPVAIRSAMGDALAHRLSPSICKIEGRARDFAGYPILHMVGELAAARGERINLRDHGALMERAIGAHSTSDFPLLLADAANKSLLANYQTAAPTYRKWAARRSFNDFRDHSFLRVGDFPAFQPTNESGEVKFGTLSENREKVRAKQLDTGIIVGRQALANDDLGALADFSSMIAIRAASDENQRVYAILTENPKLSDNVDLFHSTHGNLAASGTVIDVDNAGKAVAALRKQKSLDGLAINLAPRFLIVGPDKELEGRKLLTAITATKAADANPWQGSMELIVDANISGNTWYVAADPSMAPSVVYGYVTGAEGPQIRTEVDFDTRAVKVAAGLDFGCGVIDFRGLYKNPGA